MKNFAEWATKTSWSQPDAVALIDPHLGISRTFAELATRTRHLAHGLQDLLGAGRGERIAVLSQNRLEYIEIYLACAASGTLLFPLNWRQAHALNILALQAASPSVVFYDTDFAEDAQRLREGAPDARWIEWHTGTSSAYEALLEEVNSADMGILSPLPAPDSLLSEPYLAVSTGGTTGVPKCAVHSQASYAGNMLNYMAAQRITEDDVFMMLGQFFHVTGYMPLAHLCLGRPVVVTNFDAEETVRVINDWGVTGFFCIATMLPRLLEVLRTTGTKTPSVRLVGYGGARMGEEVIRSAADLFNAELLQIWGMSEFGTGTTLGPAAHRAALAGERPELLRSCGRPALESEIKIIDPSGALVPRDGVTPGELCHRGSNNMLSYWNKPEETQTLLRDGWVHSGDGAVWDDLGYVYIVDRIKNMIISGGENIFPAEIERVIANMPGVAEVAVVGSPDEVWGESVRAVVVTSAESSVTTEMIRTAVEKELGSYRKPRIVSFVSSLPMTPTGKIDLRAVKSIPI